MNKFLYCEDEKTKEQLIEMGCKLISSENNLFQLAITKDTKINFATIDRSKVYVSNIMKF